MERFRAWWTPCKVLQVVVALDWELFRGFQVGCGRSG
jgi:hypothetical protein